MADRGGGQDRDRVPAHDAHQLAPAAGELPLVDALAQCNRCAGG